MPRRPFSLFLLAAVALSAQIAKPTTYFFLDAAALSTEGIWVPMNAKDHAAYQTETEIDCEKQTGRCIEATADYFLGHPHIEVINFQIIKWDREGIVASNTEGICANRTLTFGFAAKHVTDTREAKVLSPEKQQACRKLGVPASESWTFLLKNTKEWTAERDREHMH